MPNADFSSNGFNVGQDLSITIRANTGEVFRAEELGHLVDFEASSDDNEVSVRPLTGRGRPIYETVPHGWTGKLVFARMNGKIAQFLVDLQESWYEGIRRSFTIQATVLNRDGTVDSYLFTGVKFSKGSFGGFKADKEVDHNLNFRAESLKVTGGAGSLLSSS